MKMFISKYIKCLLVCCIYQKNIYVLSLSSNTKMMHRIFICLSVAFWKISFGAKILEIHAKTSNITNAGSYLTFLLLVHS